jgi:hypothetical protein
MSAYPGDESTTPIDRKARPPHELRKAVHAALKESAPASDPDPYAISPELINLFEELRADTQVEEHDRKRLRGLVRGRLEAMARLLESEQEKRPKNVETRGEVLAQQGLPGGGFGGGAGGGNAGAAGNAGGQGGFPPYDYSQQLIDLIKKTIAPTTWDDVGGPGTIRYYRPLQVLVIRQTGEVHEKIGGALGGLRGGK